MLALVERLWAEGQKVGKLPIGLQMAVPERLPQEDWEQLDETERKALLLRSARRSTPTTGKPLAIW
jgi:hypothetical protein